MARTVSTTTLENSVVQYARLVDNETLAMSTKVAKRLLGELPLYLLHYERLEVWYSGKPEDMGHPIHVRLVRTDA